MSLKEADRYAVIVQVIERTMAQADAAAWLNVSVRQVKRLVRRIRQDGPKGAVSKRWGVPSNARIADSVRQRFVALVAEHYACRHRLNFDPPCRLNFDPGMDAGIVDADCG